MAQYENLDAEFKWNVKIGDEDDIDVITRAVRKYLEHKSGKLVIGKTELCKTLGEIIEDGFLADVKQLRDQFITINNERIKEQERRLSALEKLISAKHVERMNLEQKNESLKNALSCVEDAIRAHDGEVIEADPALASAKRAYRFIYEETHNVDKASKAFNSYLLRGINQGIVEKADAEEIIKEAKQDGNKYFWKDAVIDDRRRW